MIFVKYKKIIAIGIILLMLGTASFYLKNNLKIKEEKVNEAKIEEYFNVELSSEQINGVKTITENKKSSDEYIGVLEIPKISLKRGFVNPDSKRNHVDYNIQILKSELPNIEFGNFILASHSGNGKNAYFNNINKLNQGDIIYIYYDGIRYEYKVLKKEKQAKDGKLILKKEQTSTYLTLTTCDKNNKAKQLVIYSKLVLKSKY